jgi:hypothetical protein
VPRYFFHLRNEDLWLEDCEGTDLPDLPAALDRTQKANWNTIVPLDGVYGLEFEITDSEGRTLLKVPVQSTSSVRHLPSRPHAQDVRQSSAAGVVLH